MKQKMFLLKYKSYGSKPYKKINSVGEFRPYLCGFCRKFHSTQHFCDSCPYPRPNGYFAKLFRTHKAAMGEVRRARKGFGRIEETIEIVYIDIDNYQLNEDELEW